MTRHTRAYGAWLWIVPALTTTEKIEYIPEENWRLVDHRSGKFYSLSQARNLLLPPEIPGTYVVAIGKGDHFEYEIVRQ